MTILIFRCAIGTRLMNEMILNHVKAYYHGVKDLKCPLLRAELGHKIHTFKQRMKKPRNQLKINYLNHDISDDDMEISSDENRFSKSKRKRNSNDEDNDDEKENDRYHRKVIIKSTTTTTKNEQRMVIIKKLVDDSNLKQTETMEKKFDHEYCDIMYDNEFEGLHLSHFSSYDIEPSEEIENNSISIQIDIEPSKDCHVLPLTISNEEKPNEPGES
jgi:hypothetical protein